MTNRILLFALFTVAALGWPVGPAAAQSAPTPKATVHVYTGPS